MENTAQMIQELQDLCARQAQMIETLTAKLGWYELFSPLTHLDR
jgi:hypothetical protein